MITSEVIYNGNLRTECTHKLSGNKITTDAPPDNKGKGEYFSPTDLLSTSLAACMLTFMGIAAETHHFNIDGTRAEVTKIMASDPRRVAEIVIDLFFPPNNYSEKVRKIIENAAYTCPVSKSLHPELKQTINFHF
ncbi:MAG TPA: OsmC family protein [Bacteroidia bacterium]|nr:OsmC family protein [Bacteroidia bacterium]HRS57945.1 OsmC family protein [Bacteroidia bacterium]HRU67988.1 OsmC family protein [Bacteroidia bacterium]